MDLQKETVELARWSMCTPSSLLTHVHVNPSIPQRKIQKWAPGHLSYSSFSLLFNQAQYRLHTFFQQPTAMTDSTAASELRHRNTGDKAARRLSDTSDTSTVDGCNVDMNKTSHFSYGKTPDGKGKSYTCSIGYITHCVLSKSVSCTCNA